MIIVFKTPERDNAIKAIETFMTENGIDSVDVYEAAHDKEIVLSGSHNGKMFAVSYRPDMSGAIPAAA